MRDLPSGLRLPRVILFVGVVVALANAIPVVEEVDEESDCLDAPKEIYFFCGSSCEPTCSNPHVGWCNQRCAKGCFCRNGFVRLPNGRCGHPVDCRRFR